MLRSQQRIQAAGGGLIIWLDQEGRSNGHLAKMAAEKWKKLGHSQGEAYLASGYKEDNRDYSIALKILEHFKPRAIHLLTGNPLKAAAVSSLGVRVTTEEI
jgi:GTP cyclohydrolase II